MPDRTCRVDGCTATHRRDKLMCRRHWLGLPKPLRDELWAAYRTEGVFSERYLEAADACFAHYAQDFRQGRRVAPGIYDWQGELHIDEREFIVGARGNPDDPRDVATARSVIQRVAEDQGIPLAEVETRG